MSEKGIINNQSRLIKLFNRIMQNSDDLNALVEENPKKAVKTIFFPTFFSLFCLTLNGFIDSIFVSETGAVNLIGIGVIQSIFIIIVGIGTGLAVSTNSFLSYTLSKDTSKDRARLIINNSIFLTIIVGIVSSVILVICLKPFLTLLNIGNALNPALTYGYIIFDGNIFFFFAAVIPAILKSEGEIIKATYSLVSTSLLNIVLDYILISVLGYGVLGAAFATTFCSALCCTLLVIFMIKSKNINLKLSEIIYQRDFSIMKKLFFDSIPVMMECGILSLFGFLANMLFNNFTHAADFAAFVAAYKVYYIAIIPIMALAEANVTVVAYLYGKNKFKTINELLKYEVKVATLTSLIIWLFIFIFRDGIAHLYSAGGDLAFVSSIANATPILNIILIIIPVGLLSVSLLQGTQAYKESFTVSLIRSLFLEIFLGFLFAYTIGGALGIYAGFIIGAEIGCIISYYVTRQVIIKKKKEGVSQMFNVKYNSQELEYKRPFGAVKINEDIEFNIKANALCNVKMIIKSEKGIEEFNLEKKGQENEYYIYSLKLDTSKYLGPIFYYFIFQKDDEIFFYTNKEDLLGGEGELYKTNPERYYHTYIYDLKYNVPEWFKTGIGYHVFVDRFNNDDCSLEFIDRDLVEVYGGTLRGLINKLDYLEDMGVSIILLSPIFESKSHHKYDTGDYKKISGDYGDLDTFKELIEKLKQKDMHIILDGVFNHSGSDSKYFNRYGNYDSIGAYQSKDSKYYKWYSFNNYPDDYVCWGDIDTLPQHNQSNEDFLDYILFDENSVVRYWMNLGIDGWRLDACDLLNDKFLSQIYDVVKKNNPESVIIAELWDDATNFRHHSKNEIHKYLCGNEVESVTDYPLHGLILEYCKGNHSPEKFERGYYSLIENYPNEYFYSLLNILGTHDIERVLTLLENNIELVKMAIVLLFTLPGVPLIYYGDEAGLKGGKDPDNRRPLPWSNINEEIYSQYKNLCKIRNEHDALKKGSVEFIESEDFLIYKRTFNDENIYVVLYNSSDKYLNASILSNNAIKLKDIESKTTYHENESIAIGDYKIFVEK